jgi:Na+-transporting NADH:ubiquinone oxidoreductase subunit NqrB
VVDDEPRRGAFAYNPSVLARAAAALDRAAFKPASLPNDLIIGIALAPSVIAGLIIFKVPALEMLAVALAVGTVGQIVGYLIWRKHIPRTQSSPLIAAIIGVALVGAGAALATSIAIAALGVILELLRARYIPAIRAQAGLLAFAAVALITRGAPFAYINPANGKPFGDPINVWYHFFSPASAPIDPIRLYVGNVPGPVFATSLLAVAVGAAWFAYARRVSLVVLVTFFLGALVPIYAFHWDYLFQLDSGPMWFVAALVLSDRRLLPGSWAIRPVLGFGAGLLSVGLRRSGYGIEASFFTVAGLQAVMAVFVLMFWAGSLTSGRRTRNRRLRQREAHLRVVKSVSRAG